MRRSTAIAFGLGVDLRLGVGHEAGAGGDRSRAERRADQKCAASFIMLGHDRLSPFAL